MTMSETRQREDDLITATALRFSGERYGVYDDSELKAETDAAVNSLALPADPVRQMAVLFGLQRYLMTGGGVCENANSAAWRAVRTLFLLTCNLDVPPELRDENRHADWERMWRPRIAEHIRLIAAIHAATDYAVPFGLAADNPNLAHWRAYASEEWRLLNEVHRAWHAHGRLETEEFLRILIWKARRAMPYYLRRLTQGGTTLDDTVMALTSEVHSAALGSTPLSPLGVLMSKYGFLLPTASAALTIYDPLRFTVYDVRSCETLDELTSSQWRKLGNRKWSPKLDQDYAAFIQAVQASSPGMTLRDADRYVFGRSAGRNALSGLAAMIAAADAKT